MSQTRDFDFEKAGSLLDLIIKAGQHGPMYQKIAGWAGEELKAMIEEEDRDAIPHPRVVTPPEGPANSAIANKDGSYTKLSQAPLPDGVRDESGMAGTSEPGATNMGEANAAVPVPKYGEPGYDTSHLNPNQQAEYNREFGGEKVEAPADFVPDEGIDRRRV